MKPCWEVEVINIKSKRGVVLSVVHTMHISTLFENDRHFSHLADFEREMVYRTEMGLYYSYYKTLITAPTLYVGLHEITHDNVTEYGHTINTLKRFNLYPEVILGAAYRLFKRVVALTKWKAETCWRVNRGDNLPPVESCEGIGNQHYFYVWNVFALFGTVAAVVFFISIIVGGSVFGGLIAACCFFFNHGEATRVQWTPPLRESFGYPVFILQILVVTYILRNNRSGLMWTFSVAALTTTFMLFWQFAAFALSTQVGSLFGTFILDFVPTSTIATIVRGHAIGFGIAYILLFGNEMLLTSLFLSSVITFLLILGLDGTLNRIRFRPLYLLVNSVVFIGGTLGIKVAIGRAVHINDDEHIFDILRSKFTNFANFHTRLYTCAREFDFLGVDFLTPVSLTLLLPAAVVTAQLLCTYMARFELPFCLTRNGSRNKQYAEIVYNAIQCVCFAIMAGMIMRLKLFFTPHLCIMAAVLANTKFVSQAIGRRISIGLHRFILVALVAMMAVKGVQNIQKQRGIQGEYSNPEQEKLFEWIVKNTRSDAVFAGTMPVMANVKLSTNRPIVNHPHYEDAMLRARTLKVYSMYSKKPLSEVHAALKDMRVEYFVYQPELCIPHPTKPECSYRSIWDLEDPKNIDRESLCDVYERAFMTRNFTILNPFKLVYSARAYAVFKL
ncbi:C-mannosyltransferase dpy-19 [Toxocara canis]|uniref:C-mannosyltransferase dpy-19 n=1 Tax=Toxocara canis TaxID=6265 RepID=A0A0B2VC16_TOXCA|nr:C-mannosyltransferase dpy-19 [Toxocara canis]